MKNAFLTIGLALGFLLSGPTATAQSEEITQLLLNVEKLAQFKQILSDMKKGYQILEGGYDMVKDISEGNFSLHKSFLDGLLQVSPAVRNYKRISDIIDCQVILVREYRRAYDRFRRDPYFRGDELAYLGRVYGTLFRESLRHLDELLSVVTGGQLRMGDTERLEAIDRIYEGMSEKLLFLRRFNQETTVLAVQRAKQKNDVALIRTVYGLNH